MRFFYDAPRNLNTLLKNKQLPASIAERLAQVPPWVNFFIALYERCKRYSCLPVAGGMLSQPIRYLTILDIIDDEMSKRAEQSKAERDAIQEAWRRMGKRGG